MTSRKAKRTPKTHAQAVEYVEDRLRRQFFKDFPFEAYQPRTLVESGQIAEPHPIEGAEWKRLRQHGRSPTSEDAIRFAASLHEHHSLPLSVAYHQATSQFRSLRSEQTVAQTFALNEAIFFGAHFGPTEVDRGYTLANRALDTWYSTGSAGRKNAISAKKIFTPVWKGRKGTQKPWTRGLAYTKRWMRDMPPSFWPTKGQQERRAVKKAAKEAPLLKARMEAQLPTVDSFQGLGRR